MSMSVVVPGPMPAGVRYNQLMFQRRSVPYKGLIHTHLAATADMKQARKEARGLA